MYVTEPSSLTNLIEPVVATRACVAVKFFAALMVLCVAAVALSASAAVFSTVREDLIFPVILSSVPSNTKNLPAYARLRVTLITALSSVAENERFEPFFTSVTVLS